ncbi:hypothetical protein T484DRAFT_1747613 [Baffinella frigidus]|nr:hypothetical protein T484DRAFT_1747613 [Cryptophyta sp. CCMP2293]
MGTNINQQYAYSGMPGATTQNVSVVDFKPDVMANHYAQQLQQQHQMNNAAMTASAVPSIGLIGHDGLYKPAVKTSSSYIAPGSYDHPGHANAPNGLHEERIGAPYNDPCYRSYHDPFATNSSVGDGFGLPRRRDGPGNGLMSDDQIRTLLRNHNDRGSVREVRTPAPMQSYARTPVNPYANTQMNSRANIPMHRDMANRHPLSSRSETEQRHIVGKAVRDVLHKYRGMASDSAASRYPTSDNRATGLRY